MVNQFALHFIVHGSWQLFLSQKNVTKKLLGFFIEFGPKVNEKGQIKMLWRHLEEGRLSEGYLLLWNGQVWAELAALPRWWVYEDVVITFWFGPFHWPLGQTEWKNSILSLTHFSGSKKLAESRALVAFLIPKYIEKLPKKAKNLLKNALRAI